MKKPVTIGFAGDMCTGKTTCAWNTIAKLKRMGILTGFVNDIGRDVSFSPELFDSNSDALLHVLFGLLSKQAGLACRDDVQVIVTDYTIFDWSLRLRVTTESSYALQPAIELLEESWSYKYDLLFLMDSLPYIRDGYRPPVRDAFVEEYVKMFAKLSARRPLHSTVFVNGQSYKDRMDTVICEIDQFLIRHKITQEDENFEP